VRAAAVEELPLVRLIQNIDAPLAEAVPAALKVVERWHADWSDRLGVNLDRRMRIRPDEVGLSEAKAEALAKLQVLGASLAEGRARRAEVEDQMEDAARLVRKPG